MSVSSIEYAVIAFPGSNFKGEIIPAIQELLDKGIVRLLDLVVVKRHASGDIEAVEVSSLPPEERVGFDGLPHEVQGLISEEDIQRIGEQLEPEMTAAFLVWENLWSSRFAEAVMNADGILLANEKIPAPVVKEALEYARSIGAA